jgi:hypothetical protein
MTLAEADKIVGELARASIRSQITKTPPKSYSFPLGRPLNAPSVFALFPMDPPQPTTPGHVAPTNLENPSTIAKKKGSGRKRLLEVHPNTSAPKRTKFGDTGETSIYPPNDDASENEEMYDSSTTNEASPPLWLQQFQGTTSSMFLQAHKMVMDDKEGRNILSDFTNCILEIASDARAKYIREMYAGTNLSKIAVKDKSISEALVEISGVFKLSLEALICPYEASNEKIDALISQGLRIMPQKEAKFTVAGVRELFDPESIGFAMAAWASAFVANAQGPVEFTSWRDLCKKLSIAHSNVNHAAIFLASAAGLVEIIKR